MRYFRIIAVLEGGTLETAKEDDADHELLGNRSTLWNRLYHVGSTALLAELAELGAQQVNGTRENNRAAPEYRDDDSREEMKQYRISFPGHDHIPPFTVWAHSYNRNGEGEIQFWNEGESKTKMYPVLRLSATPPAKIEEVTDDRDYED
jgi:hypothetical protein